MCDHITLDESAILATLRLTMNINEWKVNGKKRWVVDGKFNGKRRREQFRTKAQAEAWVKGEDKDTSQARLGGLTSPTVTVLMSWLHSTEPRRMASACCPLSRLIRFVHEERHSSGR